MFCYITIIDNINLVIVKNGAIFVIKFYIMEFQLKFKVNQSLFLKDPEGSTVGKAIVAKSIDLIYGIGFEQFTFKKLAQEINTTEATIYRYFSSKHKLLLYIMSWYWQYLEFLTKMRLSNVKNSKEKLEQKSNHLKHKKAELNDIMSETQKEESFLSEKSAEYEGLIEERLLAAYKRIRSSVRNGLAVVAVERDACGGCFNSIPPQRQSEIRLHKKIIVCENCGRILVDADLNDSVDVK